MVFGVRQPHKTPAHMNTLRRNHAPDSNICGECTIPGRGAHHVAGELSFALAICSSHIGEHKTCLSNLWQTPCRAHWPKKIPIVCCLLCSVRPCARYCWAPHTTRHFARVCMVRSRVVCGWWMRYYVKVFAHINSCVVMLLAPEIRL